MSLEQFCADQVASCCRERRCDEAIRHLQGMLRIQKDNYEAWYQLGICHSGSCRHVEPDEKELALDCFQTARRRAGAEAPPLDRARILSGEGNAWCKSSRSTALARANAAIDCHGQAAQLYLSYHRLDEWAREENNLGLVWCDFPDEQPRKWERAIDHFERALIIRTRERDPEGHAATCQNLGTACRALPTGDPIANSVKAIRYYHEALRFHRIRNDAWRIAALQNNLGNACLSWAMHEKQHRGRKLRHALRHFDAALTVRTREEHPIDYASTQFNRGQVLLELNRPGDLEEAIACFVAAEECHPGLAPAAEVLLARIPAERRSAECR